MRVGLSLDGGGCRGLISSKIASHIEVQTGPLAECVDMMYGTSTGGIIALGASRDPAMSMEAMVNLYLHKSSIIFGTKRWRGYKGLVSHQYDEGPLNHLMADRFHDQTMESLTVPTGVTSYDLRHTRPHFFKSWLPRDKNVPIRDAARATSAAWPTFFAPKIITDLEQTRIDASVHVLVDGGFIGNNPSLFCYADMTELFQDEEEIRDYLDWHRRGGIADLTHGGTHGRINSPQCERA